MLAVSLALAIAGVVWWFGDSLLVGVVLALIVLCVAAVATGTPTDAAIYELHEREGVDPLAATGLNLIGPPGSRNDLFAGSGRGRYMR